MRYGVDKLILAYPRQERLTNSIELQLQGTASTLKVIPIDVTADREPVKFF